MKADRNVLQLPFRCCKLFASFSSLLMVQVLGWLLGNVGVEPQLAMADVPQVVPQVVSPAVSPEIGDTSVEILGDASPDEGFSSKQDAVFLGEGASKCSLSQYKGKVVVIHLWANWNIESVLGLQKLNKFATFLRKRGDNTKIQILAINVDVDTSEEAIRKIYALQGIDVLEIFRDQSGALASSLEMVNPPLTLVWHDELDIEEVTDILALSEVDLRARVLKKWDENDA